MNGSRILKKRKKSVELSLSERMFNNFKLNIKSKTQDVFRATSFFREG